MNNNSQQTNTLYDGEKLPLIRAHRTCGNDLDKLRDGSRNKTADTNATLNEACEKEKEAN